MKILFLWMASLGALCAQDIVGTWQGAVTPNGQERRIVIKITRDSGNLNAALYRIDGNPRPIPSSAVTLQGSAVKITFPAASLTYEGRASADGNSISGAVSQESGPLTLNLTRATPATAWTIPEPPPPPTRMAEAKNDSKGTLPGFNSQGLGRMRARNATVADLAFILQLRVLDRPALDQSGMTDRFDFTLEWTPDEFQYPGAAAAQRAAIPTSPDAPPDLLIAFQEQLGMKLKATKAPANVFVIDRVSRPSEN